MNRLTSLQWTWVLIAAVAGIAAVYNALQTASARTNFETLQAKRNGLRKSRDTTIGRLERIQEEVQQQRDKYTALALELESFREQVSLLKNHTKDLERVAEELVLLDEAVEKHAGLAKEFEQLFVELSEQAE